MVETFGEKMTPTFVETLDALKLAEKLNLDLAPVMIYGDDVTHIVTEEGIANLLLCRDAGRARTGDPRRRRAYTDVGRAPRSEDGRAAARARRDPPSRRSRHRSAGRRPQPARGAFDQGSGALVAAAFTDPPAKFRNW